MQKQYKAIISELKKQLNDLTVLSYLKNNFTRITNCGVGEQYEKDFNLSTLANQKLIKKYIIKIKKLSLKFTSTKLHLVAFL